MKKIFYRLTQRGINTKQVPASLFENAEKQAIYFIEQQLQRYKEQDIGPLDKESAACLQKQQKIQAMLNMLHRMTLNTTPAFSLQNMLDILVTFKNRYEHDYPTQTLNFKPDLFRYCLQQCHASIERAANDFDYELKREDCTIRFLQLLSELQDETPECSKRKPMRRTPPPLNLDTLNSCKLVRSATLSELQRKHLIVDEDITPMDERVTQRLKF